MCVIHLDANEWLIKSVENKSAIHAKTLVLDQGIAGIVYYFSDNKKNVYYLDQFYPASLKKKKSMPFLFMKCINKSMQRCSSIITKAFTMEFSIRRISNLLLREKESPPTA